MCNDEMSGCLKGQPFVVTGEVILYGENKGIYRTYHI